MTEELELVKLKKLHKKAKKNSMYVQQRTPFQRKENFCFLLQRVRGCGFKGYKKEEPGMRGKKGKTKNHAFKNFNFF